MAGRKIEINEKGHIVLKLRWKSVTKLLGVLLAVFISAFLPLPGITEAGRICFMLFVGAAGLWMTEAIPPFATGIMVIVLSVFLLGQPGGPLALEGRGLYDSYQIFLNPISSPILVLFFGGFVIALAASKHGLDLRLAKALLKPFGTKPSHVLLGIILITALFSMFMSNTATTAMMMAITAPLFARFRKREPFQKALIISVPFAANIGGMGTIIGTPPNAVAVSILERLGHPVSFGKWMVIAVPIVLVMLFVLWQVVYRIYRPREKEFTVLFPDNLVITWDLVVVAITFFVTVSLWLLQPLTGITSAVVALLPIMVFTVFGILTSDDLRNIEWHVLILIAGGMTLGVAMKQTGLSELLVGYIRLLPLSTMLLLGVMGLFALILSNFMSNTAAANLIIPIVIAVEGISPVTGAVVIALACSLAMSLPISTPPNAIAYSTGLVQTRDLARIGSVISIIGIILVFAALPLWIFLGLL